MNERETSSRLSELDARLRAARDARNVKEHDRATKSKLSGVGFAFRIGVELVAALIVGVGIGLLLDRWLDTAPWFLIGGFFVGAGAGIVNVYRATSNYGLAVGYREPTDATGEESKSKAPTKGVAQDRETGNRTAKE